MEGNFSSCVGSWLCQLPTHIDIAPFSRGERHKGGEALPHEEVASPIANRTGALRSGNQRQLYWSVTDVLDTAQQPFDIHHG